jgi:hypothetical protein
MLGSSRVAAQLAASQEGLSSMSERHWAENINFIFFMHFLRLSVTASLIRQGIFFNASFLADRSGSAVQGPEYLRPLEHWDRGFESHSRHILTGCSKSLFIETIHCLAVIIFICVQIFIAAGVNTIVTLVSVSTCVTDVFSQFAFGSK